jgi:hypothetical protein
MRLRTIAAHATLVSLALLPVQVRRAAASCFPPAMHALLWSYPADGAVDVPTDATFWALTNHIAPAGRPRVTLDGRDLPPNDRARFGNAPRSFPNRARSRTGGTRDDAPEAMAVLLGTAGPSPRYAEVLKSHMRIDPGPLAPNTAHSLTLRYDAAGDGPGAVCEIHFTTGKRRGRAQSASRVVDHGLLPVPDSGVLRCEALLATQACFDTVLPEPRELHTLVFRGGPVLGWLVSSGHQEEAQLWPAACGGAALIAERRGAPTCLTIEPIGPGGSLLPSYRHCATSKAESARTQQLSRALWSSGRAAGPSSTSGLRPRQPNHVLPVPVVPISQPAAAEPPKASTSVAPASTVVPATSVRSMCSLSTGTSAHAGESGLLLCVVAVLRWRRKRLHR